MRNCKLISVILQNAAKRRSAMRALMLSLVVAAPVFFASAAQAQTDAYSIRVAVSDRSDKEQQDAHIIGMRSVLLANSGDKTLLNRDDVRAALRTADAYVESFRYDTPEPGSTIPRSTPVTSSVRSTGQATALMFIQFNRELISELILPSTAAPVAEDAPITDPFSQVSSALTWLVVEDANRQILISAGSGRNVMDRAREIAGGLNISLSFPAGDANDQQALGEDDIKGAVVERVMAAASRYAQPLTLAAYLSRSRTGGWEGSWLKVAQGQQLNETFTSTSLDEALQQGINWLAKPAAASSGAAPQQFQSTLSANSSTTEGLLWISPLPTTQSYARVMNFLSSQSGVDVVFPKEVLSGGVVFAVLPRGAVSNLASAANSTGWLRQSALPNAANESRYASGITASLEYLR